MSKLPTTSGRIMMPIVHKLRKQVNLTEYKHLVRLLYEIMMSRLETIKSNAIEPEIRLCELLARHTGLDKRYTLTGHDVSGITATMIPDNNAISFSFMFEGALPGYMGVNAHRFQITIIPK